MAHAPSHQHWKLGCRVAAAVEAQFGWSINLFTVPVDGEKEANVMTASAMKIKRR